MSDRERGRERERDREKERFKEKVNKSKERHKWRGREGARKSETEIEEGKECNMCTINVRIQYLQNPQQLRQRLRVS